MSEPGKKRKHRPSRYETIVKTSGVCGGAAREGDCLAMQLDRPTMFHNPMRKPARYAVVIASETPSKR